MKEGWDLVTVDKMHALCDAVSYVFFLLLLS